MVSPVNDMSVKDASEKDGSEIRTEMAPCV
jgi:hypothetical protein